MFEVARVHRFNTKVPIAERATQVVALPRGKVFASSFANH
jgi:hypothetical protein